MFVGCFSRLHIFFYSGMKMREWGKQYISVVTLQTLNVRACPLNHFSAVLNISVTGTGTNFANEFWIDIPLINLGYRHRIFTTTTPVTTMPNTTK